MKETYLKTFLEEFISMKNFTPLKSAIQNHTERNSRFSF